MTKSKHLTAADRRVIETLLKRDCTKLEIAKELCVARSTVGREIAARSTPAGYFADVAQLSYDTNRRSCGKPFKLSDSKTQSYVINKLKSGWSPDEISGRIKRNDNPDTFGLVYACNEL